MQKLLHLLFIGFIVPANISIIYCQQIYPKIDMRYHFQYNSSIEPDEIIYALYTKFDNKNFRAERSKMTPEQANLMLWNAVGNITSYTNLFNQLIRYKEYEKEIIELYKKMGYGSDYLECIKIMFKSAVKAHRLKLNKDSWVIPNCYKSNPYDSILIRYISIHLDELVRDQNGKPITNLYTGQLSYFDEFDYYYITLNINKGRTVTAEYYDSDLQLRKFEWFYPSGRKRYELVNSFDGKKSHEQFYHPNSEIIQKDVKYFENGKPKSEFIYKPNWELESRKYFNSEGKLITRFGVLNLKDSVLKVVPLEAYDSLGKSIIKDGTGYIEMYEYINNEKILIRQEFKDYILNGKTTYFHSKGNQETVYENGIVLYYLEYYQSGPVKAKYIYNNKKKTYIENYPKFKKFKILLEQELYPHNGYLISNDETRKIKEVYEKIECVNCSDVWRYLFNEEWVKSDMNIFDKEYLDYYMYFNIDNKNVIRDIQITNISNIEDTDNFKKRAISLISNLKYKNLPILNQNEYIPRIELVRIKIIESQ